MKWCSKWEMPSEATFQSMHRILKRFWWKPNVAALLHHSPYHIVPSKTHISRASGKCCFTKSRCCSPRFKVYWKDPEVFRPERHLNEDGTKVIKSDHFYPFGLGISNCSVVWHYFLFTAALIKKFRFEPVENEPLPSLNPKIGFTLGYQGFKAVITPRSWSPHFYLLSLS